MHFAALQTMPPKPCLEALPTMGRLHCSLQDIDHTRPVYRCRSHSLLLETQRNNGDGVDG
jgi:hypothetical protein